MDKNDSQKIKDLEIKKFLTEHPEFRQYKGAGEVEGKQRTFGFPVDPKLFDLNSFYGNSLKNSSSFSSALCRALLKIGEDSDNPLSIIINKEDEEIEAQVKQMITEWLPQALNRLSKDQEISICLRFRLDDSAEKKMRKEEEIAEIIGITQQGVSRNIKMGLKALKKDFKKNLEPRIKRLKS